MVQDFFYPQYGIEKRSTMIAKSSTNQNLLFDKCFDHRLIKHGTMAQIGSTNETPAGRWWISWVTNIQNGILMNILL